MSKHFRTKIDEIEQAEENLKDAKEKFLRDAGWKYTSQTPGHYWMWTRKIQYAYGITGAIVSYDALMTLNDAVSCQKAMFEMGIE